MGTEAKWLFGGRVRWLVILPMLGLLSATAEVTLLVSVVHALLLLVSDESAAPLQLGPLNVTLSLDHALKVAAAGGLFSIALRTVDSSLVGRLSASAAHRSRSALIETYFHQSWEESVQQRSGQLQHLIGGGAQTASNAVPLIGNALAATANLSVYALFVTFASPTVALLFAVVAIVVVLAFARLRSATKVAAAESLEETRELQLSATALSSMMREILLFSAQGEATRSLARLNDDSERALRRLRTLQRLIPGLFQQVLLLAVVGVIALASALDLGAAAFGTAAILAVRSLSYVQQLNASALNFLEAAPYLIELRDAMRGGSLHTTAGTDALDHFQTLQLQDVTYTYAASPALMNVDLVVNRGDRIAVVGPSGCGKSTLAHVIVRLIRPTGGVYEVNGRDAHSFSSESWSRRVALLSQEPRLLRGSIEENIAFFRPGESEQARSAASLAHIADDIEQMEHRWASRVGDGEGDVSGGQRQRLALARALYASPELIVLDEPTSALDATSAQVIEDSLRDLDSGTTLIVISHRPELLALCTRAIVMEAGRIVRDTTIEDDTVGTLVGQLRDEH